jgi:5-methylcytosine-specific restriction endonuclease McrBC GTP-binding regulatory subunit McrB
MTTESEIKKQYELWDEFRSAWPIERLERMTLDEYTNAGSDDTFTRWLEARLAPLGSIWGGSSFKFGVYSRLATDKKSSDHKLSYSSTHGWYTRYGKTADEAFTKVRGFVVSVARMAQQGDIAGIDAFEHLGEAVKWKIAFHYQALQEPVIVNVFKRAPLAAFLGALPGRSMADLQEEALSLRPASTGLLEYGHQVWGSWGRHSLPIWKLSHGKGEFSTEEFQQYLDGDLAVMHRDTKRKQGQSFVDAPDGTVFFLTHSNSIQLLGQLVSPALPCPRGDGWIQRKYRVMKLALRNDRYTANKLGWSPQANSTFMKVKPEHMAVFERTLLRPYFDVDLAAVAAWAGQSFDADEQVATPDPEVIAKSRPTASVPVQAARNRIFYGPPGTGKTHRLAQEIERYYADAVVEPGGDDDANDGSRHRFVTFHQSYGYEEFVEGLRPVLRPRKDEGGKTDEAPTGDVAYEIRPGVFRELCDKARKEPGRRFAMVIDEINRGNISKILGELITLIEPDKRDLLDGSLVPAAVTLAYSGDVFSVPANVDIIATMNTADRSLALLDTALRRRFEFIPMLPDTRSEQEDGDEHSAPLRELRIATDSGEIDVRRMLERMNERIETLYDRDHMIGHAYFTSLLEEESPPRAVKELASIFRRRIIPLLEEYFFEDWAKIRLVLGDNQKGRRPDLQFIVERSDSEQDLEALFGVDHDLESHNVQRRYVVQDSAFERPEAYIGIYQPTR